MYKYFASVFALLYFFHSYLDKKDKQNTCLEMKKKTNEEKPKKVVPVYLNVKAPVFTGWILVVVAKLITNVRLVRETLARDYRLGLWRQYKDITEEPSTLSIHKSYIGKPEDAEFNNPILELDLEKRSKSPFLSFWDYHMAYKSHKTTPSQVARNLIKVLDEKNKTIHAIRFISHDLLDQAEESTRRYKAGCPLSQMDGVFVTVKEEIGIRRLEMKLGTTFVNDGNPCREDSTIITKLRAAGAIIVGSAIMNELGWDTFTINPNTGIPKNPYSPSYSCGGSSGGSSCSVSSGIVPISIAADGAGSVRVPAAFCGLYGLKTTFGRISNKGCADLALTVGSYGPIAATADDLALAYSVIAGPDTEDKHTLLQPPLSFRDYYNYEDLSDLTIATIPDWEVHVKDRVILDKMSQLKVKLTKLGAHFVELDYPMFDSVHIANNVLICSEIHRFALRYQDQVHKFLGHTQVMLGISTGFEGRDYILAHQVRTKAMNHFHECFGAKKIDLIMIPTAQILAPKVPRAAHKHGQNDIKLTESAMMYCSLGNIAGIPGLNVPYGYSDNELPVGLQFMSAWWNEALLLRMAKACESLPDNPQKLPKQNWFSNEILK